MRERTLEVFFFYLLGNVLGLIIDGYISRILLIWYFMAPVITLSLCVIMWRAGIKRYSSASS